MRCEAVGSCRFVARFLGHADGWPRHWIHEHQIICACSRRSLPLLPALPLCLQEGPAAASTASLQDRCRHVPSSSHFGELRPPARCCAPHLPRPAASPPAPLLTGEQAGSQLLRCRSTAWSGQVLCSCSRQGVVLRVAADSAGIERAHRAALLPPAYPSAQPGAAVCPRAGSAAGFLASNPLPHPSCRHVPTPSHALATPGSCARPPPSPLPPRAPSPVVPAPTAASEPGGCPGQQLWLPACWLPAVGQAPGCGGGAAGARAAASPQQPL